MYYNPSAIITLGDFNVGNIFLDEALVDNHSGLTHFDLLLKNTLEGLGLVELIHQPTRISDTAANLRDLVMISSTGLVVDSGLLSPFSHIDHIPTYIPMSR